MAINTGIDLTTKFLPYVDEAFTAESKTAMLTNQDFNWSGAHSVKIYTIGTATMNDYDRSNRNLNPSSVSRYGSAQSLSATTREYTLNKDRSFSFEIDSLDQDETQQALNSAAALGRQTREVIVPEVDSYVYSKMTQGAGSKPDAKALTAAGIYSDILAGSTVLDNALVPETGRVLVVTPATYQLLKQSPDIVMNTDIGNDLRLKGVLGVLDGMNVIKVPAVRLPEKFGFMIAHPCATVAPQKLNSYNSYVNPPGVNGTLVEGRIAYDAFVLENKKMAIYYQALV